MRPARRCALVVIGLLAAVAVVGGGPARGAPTADGLAAQRAPVLAKDADDLRRLAKWGDENGLDRTADADWEEVLRLDPDDAAARKRLRYLRQGKAWVRDAASWALVRTAPDARPAARADYAARRRVEVDLPSAARHRDLAVALRAAGHAAEADAECRLALARDPDDLWCRLALGEVPDPVEGWVPADLRRRRIASARVDAEVRRLRAMGVEPVRDDAPGPRSAAAGKPLAVWRLRDWVLETDLDDDAAAAALATADLGARWFRSRFGIPATEPLLPGEGRFVVLTTHEDYVKVVEAEPNLVPAVRTFAKSVSAVPLPRGKRKDTVVLMERPEAVFAVDGCLHYAIHVLFRERFGVEAEEAWLYEGLAAYVTLRVLGTQASWCIALEETRAGVAERAPHAETWGEQAVELAHARRDEPLKRLLFGSLNELDGPMLVKAWSMLRFLLEDHPDEGIAFLEARRDGGGSEAALRRATGLGVDEIDAAWRLATVAHEGE